MMPGDQFTVYDISIDETRPMTEDDLEMFKAVYSAFGMQREAEKALMALTLAVGQRKISSTDAWHILHPLTDWAASLEAKSQ